MKNFVQHGDVIAVPAPRDVHSGDGVQVGSLFGVATTNAESGAAVEVLIEGVVILDAAEADAATVGAKAYWDDSAHKVTTTATDNALIGAFTAPKAAATGSATVRLNAVTI